MPVDALFLTLLCHMLKGCCALSLLRLLHVSSQTLKCRPTTRSPCKWIGYPLIKHPNYYVLRCHLICCGIRLHLFAPKPNAIFLLFPKRKLLSHLQTRTSSHMSNLNLLCNKVHLVRVPPTTQCRRQAHAWKRKTKKVHPQKTFRGEPSGERSSSDRSVFTASFPPTTPKEFAPISQPHIQHGFDSIQSSVSRA